MAKFTIQDLFSIAPKYNYINDSYNRNIATFHHAKNQKIMTVEQMIMGIHITIIEKKTGDIIPFDGNVARTFDHYTDDIKEEETIDIDDINPEEELDFNHG